MRKIVIILLITHCSLLIAQLPTQEWIRRYTDTTSEQWSSSYVKSDAQGNIYILAGINQNFGYLKYNANGDLLKVTIYWPMGFSSSFDKYFDVTANGEVYITEGVTIGLNEWIYTVKYNSSGIFQWGKIFNQTTTNYPAGIQIDTEGNIVIAGGENINNTLYMLTIKYNPSGDTLWTRRFNNGSTEASTKDIALDNSNNIYVTGGTGLPVKCTTLKYNSSGQLLFFNTFTSNSSLHFYGHGISVDLSGNIYVIGTHNVVFSGSNNFLLKLNNNCEFQWNKIFTGIVSGQGRNDGVPIGPVISNDGNSIYYLTRSSNGTGGGGYSIVTLKYNSSGDSQWVKIFNGGGIPGTANFPSSIKLDRFNNIYVCGIGYYNISKNDFITVKYTPYGTQQWQAVYTGVIATGNDYAKDLFIDTNFNVYVNGYGPNLHSGTDAILIKYSRTVFIRFQIIFPMVSN